jgi:hypothetical protein
LLSNSSKSREIAAAKAQTIAKVLLKLLKDCKLTPEKCYTIMDFVIESLHKEK